ncbi:uncharacterized protein LOC128888868 [Hylaeus anthracinus]|uniref:uncharacterized protein LOC128888868 n=1 Tax=Hylaeus anthracinus TaxID=313031 RepID=UPI0023B9B84E|nr:uncharacterized protein LOC128888868 [Hylaeus anthracinus]
MNVKQEKWDFPPLQAKHKVEYWKDKEVPGLVYKTNKWNEQKEKERNPENPRNQEYFETDKNEEELMNRNGNTVGKKKEEKQKSRRPLPKYFRTTPAARGDLVRRSGGVRVGSESRVRKSEKRKERKRAKKEIESWCWEEDKVQSFKDKTGDRVFEQEGVEESWIELGEGIRECAVRRKRKIKERKIEYKLRWDKECGQRKRKLKRLYRKWKAGKVEREEYVKGRTELRKLYEEKEKRKKEEELEEIKGAKTEAQIWKYINKERKKRIMIEKSIRIEEWAEHFRNLLGGSQEKVTEVRRQRGSEGDGEEELSHREIEEQIPRS